MKFEASIIIPLLQQVDEWLTQAVLSALDQTVPCEVIVVTSPATRPSNLEVLHRLSMDRANLLVLRQNPGEQFAAALNLGIGKASSDRIGFLMSDDWLSAEAVAACMRRSEDIVSTGRMFYAADGTTALRELAEDHSEALFMNLRTMVDRATFLNHFFLIRKAALERAGGVDETIGNSPGVDDFDLIWRMLEQGASAGIVPDCLYHYRDHEGVRLTRKDSEEMMATFQRILDKHPISVLERRRILAEHSPWFGTSMRARYQELTPSANLSPLMRRLQHLYRSAVPLRTRLAFHDRFLRRLRKFDDSGPRRP